MNRIDLIGLACVPKIDCPGKFFIFSDML